MNRLNLVALFTLAASPAFAGSTSGACDSFAKDASMSMLNQGASSSPKDLLDEARECAEERKTECQKIKKQTVYVGADYQTPSGGTPREAEIVQVVTAKCQELSGLQNKGEKELVQLIQLRLKKPAEQIAKTVQSSRTRESAALGADQLSALANDPWYSELNERKEELSLPLAQAYRSTTKSLKTCDEVIKEANLRYSKERFDKIGPRPGIRD